MSNTSSASSLNLSNVLIALRALAANDVRFPPSPGPVLVINVEAARRAGVSEEEIATARRGPVPVPEGWGVVHKFWMIESRIPTGRRGRRK